MSRKRSPRAIVLAASATLLSLIGSFFAVLFAGFACWESCDDRSTRWQDDPDAWQWGGTLCVAGVAALCSIYGLWAAATGRRSVPALCVSAVLWIAWWTWLNS